MVSGEGSATGTARTSAPLDPPISLGFQADHCHSRQRCVYHAYVQSTHATRIANMLGGLAVAVVDQLRASSRDAALLAVDSHPERTLMHLSTALGRSHSATVRLVDGLTREGLVLRRPGSDTRTVVLTLTESGAATAQRLRNGRARILNELTGSMSPEDAAALEPLLEKLLAATARDAAARWRICRLCEEPSCEDGRPCPVDAAAPPDQGRDE